MVFDLIETDIDDSQFVCEDCPASAYGECKEELPPNDPQPRGIVFTMRAFVNYNHSDELTTQQSRTGFIIFLDSYPIYWF